MYLRKTCYKSKRQDRTFKTKNFPLFFNSSISTVVINTINDICSEEDTYLQKGSGGR